ncbi:hypothetical protein [Solilutibacter silvestris]|uniref:hypothetical protein n=1 Tax=Solilutibacter silvestris TaxID=1645665 RepID=UPI003D348696
MKSPNASRSCWRNSDASVAQVVRRIPRDCAAARLRGEIGTREALAYVGVQVIAAIVGVLLAHAMFGLPLVQPGIHARTGMAQWLSEGVATFGLVLTILLGLRHRPAAIPALVASYIFAAYWFTASTSFANPAVTIARSLTQTFAGIRPDDVAAFVLAQLVGAAIGLWVVELFDARVRSSEPG